MKIEKDIKKLKLDCQTKVNLKNISEHYNPVIKDALVNHPATARAFYKHFKKAKTTREKMKCIAKELNIYKGYKDDFIKIELGEKLQVIGDAIIEVNNEISDYLKYDSSPPGELYDKKQEAEYWFEEVKSRLEKYEKLSP